MSWEVLTVVVLQSPRSFGRLGNLSHVRKRPQLEILP
jgi:hypothetical protein